MELRGYPVEEWVRDRYPNTPLRRPAAELDRLVDVSAITRELGWAPSRRMSLEVDRG
jgi:hypothetical protein